MRKGFLYYLFSKNKLPLYLDGRGFVQEGDQNYNKADGQPAHLQYAPDGWRDALVKYARNIKYFGLFRDMSVPMKFVGDGAKILRNRMWSEGIDGTTYFGISKLDRLNTPYNYRNWYLSEINFVKFKEDQTGVTVEALEGGLNKFIKAYESTTYEIPVDDDPDAVSIYMDGMEFDQVYNYSVSQTSNADTRVPLLFLNQEGTSFLVENASQTDNPDGYFIRNGNQSPINIHIKGELKFKVSKEAQEVHVFLYKTGNNQTLPVQVSDFKPVNQFTTYTVSYDRDINLSPGDQLTIRINVVGTSVNVTTGVTLATATFEETPIKVTFTSRYQPTTIKGHLPFNLLKKLIEKMTDSQYTIRSSFLKNLGSEIVITSGDAIRGIAHSVIKTSLSDFFQSHFANWSIGLGIEGDVLVIEKLDYFFNKTLLVGIGQVKDAEITPAEDLLFNTIKNGYKNQDYNDVNGKYEFNQGQGWTTSIKKLTKELNLVSTYRADSFGIEYIRANLDNKSTTDASSDPDTFFLGVRLNQSVYNLYRPTYTITGLLHPSSAFNIELSPKRGLLRNGGYVHSLLDFQDSQSIVYQTSDKNASLSTTLNGVAITEKQDIQIGSLLPQLFKPYYFTFTTQVPINLLETMNQNPYGQIEFVWNGLKWYGYLMDGGIRPEAADVQQWKLLAAPNQDLSKFNS